ncbi:methyltransferase domain-containing protein [Altererythrobacter xixiisoli]|uniref:Methyltransferase domain-containing protein n=1 Tax=Croceibacterium xixiisoli TaxID=1476466 RepID=A0A6I4TRH7_9SPHN|nr:class I SAM-dependent methyltransferase [Croceibacterium xixiisoli]MXO98502.1 methyltransferase domain-containing protein [Croceibacterium xixiisoli]
MNRTDGYTTDVTYPAFFYKEMQPLWLSSVGLLLGFTPLDVTRPFSLCELGCGTGTNLLVAAACHPQADFTGVDFNEAHLQAARAAADAAGLTNIRFVHSAFAEFSASDGRQYDVITSHGVWSWIAPQHRAGLLACVTAGLKPGGLFYLHYMSHPGSSSMIPLQNLLNVFAQQIPAPSDRQMAMALKLVRQLADQGLFVDQPELLRHLANLESRDPAHLAHEFLTDHWQPQHAVDLHQQIGTTGLSFLGSADVFNNIDPALSIPGNLQGLIRQTGVPVLAETLKDMARNTHQRMDLFQRDPHPLQREEWIQALLDMVITLLPRGHGGGPAVFATPIGDVEAPQDQIDALLHSLADGPQKVSQLVHLPAFAGNLGALLQMLQLLMMQERVHPVTPGAWSDTYHADALGQWFAAHGVPLMLFGECGTAVANAAGA